MNSLILWATPSTEFHFELCLLADCSGGLPELLGFLSFLFPIKKLLGINLQVVVTIKTKFSRNVIQHQVRYVFTESYDISTFFVFQNVKIKIESK